MLLNINWVDDYYFVDDYYLHHYADYLVSVEMYDVYWRQNFSQLRSLVRVVDTYLDDENDDW